MADSARRKEKQRLKRKEKQRVQRIASNITPFRKIASSGGTLECWINREWHEQGMANVYVLGNAGGGRYAFAAFLIDVWCVGLKDAWGLPEISRNEFQKKLLDGAPGQMELIRIEPQKIQGLVAGGIRFARQNGFKLPPQYDRWTAILGSLGDIGAADLSSFGKDGQLLYMGSRQFLVQRLVGMTADEFLARPNVKKVMPSEDMPFAPRDFDKWVNDQGDEVRSTLPPALRPLADIAERGTVAVEEWCIKHDQVPLPRLPEGMMIFLTALLGTRAKSDADLHQKAEQMSQNLEKLVKSPGIHQPQATIDAIKQIINAVNAMGTQTFLDHIRPENLARLET